MGGRTGKSVIRAIDFHDTNGRLLKITYFVGESCPPRETPHICTIYALVMPAIGSWSVPEGRSRNCGWREAEALFLFGGNCFRPPPFFYFAFVKASRRKCVAWAIAAVDAGVLASALSITKSWIVAL